MDNETDMRLEHSMAAEVTENITDADYPDVYPASALLNDMGDLILPDTEDDMVALAKDIGNAIYWTNALHKNAVNTDHMMERANTLQHHHSRIAIRLVEIAMKQGFTEETFGVKK
jgi:hypothetical protein